MGQNGLHKLHPRVGRKRTPLAGIVKRNETLAHEFTPEHLAEIDLDVIGLKCGIVEGLECGREIRIAGCAGQTEKKMISYLQTEPFYDPRCARGRVRKMTAVDKFEDLIIKTLHAHFDLRDARRKKPRHARLIDLIRPRLDCDPNNAMVRRMTVHLNKALQRAVRIFDGLINALQKFHLILNRMRNKRTTQNKHFDLDLARPAFLMLSDPIRHLFARRIGQSKPGDIRMRKIAMRYIGHSRTIETAPAADIRARKNGDMSDACGAPQATKL